MSKLIYSNIAASGINYPVTDFLLNIKEFYDKGDILILCYWDFNIYTFKNLDSQVIRNITSQISKFLTSIGVKHKIIYLSDALKRINNEEKLHEIFLNCLTNITIGELEDFYKKNNYLKIRPATLGKINFMVADYITALFFDELYPHLSKNKKINIYHTGERFLGLKGSIERVLGTLDLIIDFPEIQLWKTLPILNYTQGNWISASMSKKEIEKIIKANSPIPKEEIKDLIKIGLRLNDPSLKNQIDSFYSKLDTMDLELITLELTEILNLYFYKIKQLIEISDEGTIKKVTYVNSKEKFKKIFERINSSKLDILKHCNGSNTIDDIIKKVFMKPSSVRSYISRMKNEHLITQDKKPKRLVDEIIINLE